MSRSLRDISQENIKLYGTKDNTYDDFPVGTPVKIICCSQDHHFFYGETGKVISNGHRYLSIVVEYDEPRHYEGGTIEKTFNFEPDNLVIWDDITKEISIKHKKLEKLNEEERAEEISKEVLKRAEEKENKQRSERFRIMDL